MEIDHGLAPGAVVVHTTMAPKPRSIKNNQGWKNETFLDINAPDEYYEPILIRYLQ